MNVKRLKTILGRKNRPHHRKKKPAQWQITIERPNYDLTIFKVYCGKMALKIYTKGKRVLCAEAMAIDARELRCGRDVGQFAENRYHIEGDAGAFSGNTLLPGSLLRVSRLAGRVIGALEGRHNASRRY
jgi:hypothetical protein